MAYSCSGSEESESEEDSERSLSRREVELIDSIHELIDSIINPPTASQKVIVKRKRGRSLVLHAQQLLQRTGAELRAENARLHAKNQELERELASVKADFPERGLVNHLREIVEGQQKTEKKLKHIIQDSNQYCHSLRRDYKYANRDLQNLLTEACLLRAHRDRLLGSMMALTKNREDLLVELH